MRRLLVAILCGLQFFVSGQPNEKYLSKTTQLMIGDTLPEFMVRSLYNFHPANVRLSSFYKKLLILDFWGTWCGPCVDELPKIDSLNTKFKNELTILPVTDETNGKIKALMMTNEKLKGVHLVSITEDSILKSWFKHRIVPHEVWINSKGVVIAITSQLEVTAYNIQGILNGTIAGLPIKVDQMDFVLGKPVINLSWQNGDSLKGSEVKKYSALIKYRQGLPASSHLWVNNLQDAQNDTSNIFMINGATFTNFRALGLFITAFDLTFTRMAAGFLNPNRIILNVKDSLNYMEHTDTSHWYTEAYSKTHSFIYELKIEKPLPDTLFGIKMIDDLNRYFDLKGKIVKRREPCWIVEKASPAADTLSSHSQVSELYNTNQTIGIRKKQLNVLLKILSAFNDMEPVINETGITRAVDVEINIPASFNYYPNIYLIQRSLSRYGLKMVKKERMVDMLYLSDKANILGD